MKAFRLRNTGTTSDALTNSGQRLISSRGVGLQKRTSVLFDAHHYFRISSEGGTPRWPDEQQPSYIMNGQAGEMGIGSRMVEKLGGRTLAAMSLCMTRLQIGSMTSFDRARMMTEGLHGRAKAHSGAI